MSAYVVADETINLVLGYCQRRATSDRHVPGLRSLGYDCTRPADVERLGCAMFALNVAGVEARYGAGQAREFRPLDYQPGEVLAVDGAPPTLEMVAEALASWLYQCAEGDVPEDQLYQTLTALRPVLESEAKAEVAARSRARYAAESQALAELREKGKPLAQAARPAWAKAAIIAHCAVDESDSQTDYFHVRDGKWHVLAWSRHTRDRFDEMRKAAGSWEETAHLGPGKDQYVARVVASQDIRGSFVTWKGSHSSWHRDWYESGEQGGEMFWAEAEARAYIARKGTPESLEIDGKLCAFEWVICKTSSEHREKYSMGSGYYLRAEGTFASGWTVEKVNLSADTSELWEAFGAGRVHLPQAQQTSPAAPSGIRSEIARLREENARLRARR